MDSAIDGLEEKWDQFSLKVESAIKNNADTLKEDLEKSEVNSQATDVSHTTELFVDDENIVVSSPITTPNVLAKTSGGLKTKISALKVESAVDIMSIHTMSPDVDDADDEDEEGMEFQSQSSKIKPCLIALYKKHIKLNNAQ